MTNVEILNHKNQKFMFINNDLWMWDTPRERKLQENLAKQAFGDVLVVGYGFGIVVEFLLKNSKVKSITAVEKNKEVIEKIKENDLIKCDILIQDFYKLSELRKFDCIIGDIWQDIDPLFLKDYVNFKDKAKKLLKKDGKIIAWGKDYFEFLLKNTIKN